MITLHHEAPADALAIEDLLDRSFGLDRWKKTSYRYRDGIAPVPGLCFTAQAADPLKGETLVGTVRHWPILLTEGSDPTLAAVLLGPIAIEPSLKATGIGGQLMRLSIQEASRAGQDLIVLVGDPAYYQRFGFQPASAFGIVMPHEAAARVQVLPLTPQGEQVRKGGVVTRALPLVLSAAA